MKQSPSRSPRAPTATSPLSPACSSPTVSAVGVLGGSLPGLRAHLSLGPGHIVGVLVAAAVVAVFSMNLSGASGRPLGARLPALVGGAVMAGGAVLMGVAPDYAVLIVGAAVFGLGNGAMDVAMNALGVSVEQARRRPVMSRLHACFSIGNFVGALLVVALGWLVADVSPRWALWSSALLLVVLLAALARITPQSPSAPTATRTAAAARSRQASGCSPRWLSASA